MALGVEAAGRVAAVGDDVAGIAVGDAVTAHSLPLRGRGSWAQQHLAAAADVALIPPGVPWDAWVAATHSSRPGRRSPRPAAACMARPWSSGPPARAAEAVVVFVAENSGQGSRMDMMMALRAHARSGPEQLVHEHAPVPAPARRGAGGRARRGDHLRRADLGPVLDHPGGAEPDAGDPRAFESAGGQPRPPAKTVLTVLTVR
jgi:hypothetical protein